MGTAAAENIAIQVESTANTRAISTAREDVTALGRATKEATGEVAEGFKSAGESTERFASHLQDTEEGVERSRGAARGLAMEFSHLSMAAVEGEGSTMGLIRAIGLATTEMAEMSGVAELAASASVLGAVAVAVTTLVALFDSAAEKNEKFLDSLSRLTQLNSRGIQMEADKDLQYLRETQAQITANIEAIKKDEEPTANPIRQIANAVDEQQRRNENKRLVALAEELEKQIFEIHEKGIEQKEKEDDEAAREAERRAKEAARIAEENARKAAELDARMSEEKQSALDKVALNEEDQAIQKAIREEHRREAEIRALQVSEDEKTHLLILAQEDRDAQISAIHKAAVDRQAAEDKRKADEAAREAARAREQQVRAIEQSMDAGIRAHESYADIATKTLLTPVEKYLEGLAASQLIDAAADAAALNFVGAAAHAAVAALALEGAREVAQIGGLNSHGGGGSGGGSYGAGSGSDPFHPKDQQGGGATVINLMTTNPYSGENIAIASYELTRAGKLNRPIYVPPTNGLAVGGG